MDSIKGKIGTYRGKIEDALVPVAGKIIYRIDAANEKAHNAADSIGTRIDAFRKGEYGISNLFYEVGSNPVGRTTMCVFPLVLYAGAMHSHLSNSEALQDIYHKLFENDSEIMAASSVSVVVRDHKILVVLGVVGGLALLDVANGGHITYPLLDTINFGSGSPDTPIQIVENPDLPAGDAIIGDPQIEKALLGGYKVDGAIENDLFKVDNMGNMNIRPDDDVAEMVGLVEEGGVGKVYMDLAAKDGAKVIIHDGVQMIDQLPLEGVEVANENGILRVNLDLNELVKEYSLGSGARIAVNNIEGENCIGVDFNVK